MALAHPVACVLAAVKSPKSDALPVVAMVTKSIIFEFPVSYPPPQTPRIGEEQTPPPSLAAVKSPKSDAFPMDAIVQNSITLF